MRMVYEQVTFELRTCKKWERKEKILSERAFHRKGITSQIHWGRCMPILFDKYKCQTGFYKKNEVRRD